MENSNSYIFSERKEEMPISSVKLSFRKADNPDECLRHYFFGQLLSTTEGIYVTSFLSKLQNAFKAEMSNAELSVLITNEKDESKQKMFIMASRKIYPAVVSFAKENDIEFRDKQVSDLSLAPLLNLMLRLAASGKDVNGVNRLAPGTFDFGVYYFLDKKDHGRRYEAIGVSFGQEIGKSSHASIKVETKSFYPVPEGDEKNFSHYFVCQNSVGKLLGCSSIPLNGKDTSLDGYLILSDDRKRANGPMGKKAQSNAVQITSNPNAVTRTSMIQKTIAIFNNFYLGKASLSFENKAISKLANIEDRSYKASHNAQTRTFLEKLSRILYNTRITIENTTTKPEATAYLKHAIGLAQAKGYSLPTLNLNDNDEVTLKLADTVQSMDLFSEDLDDGLHFLVWNEDTQDFSLKDEVTIQYKKGNKVYLMGTDFGHKTISITYQDQDGNLAEAKLGSASPRGIGMARLADSGSNELKLVIIADTSKENVAYLDSVELNTQHISVDTIPTDAEEGITIAEKLLYEYAIKNDLAAGKFQLVNMDNFAGYKFISTQPVDVIDKESGKKKKSYIWGMLTVGQDSTFTLQKFESLNALFLKAGSSSLFLVTQKVEGKTGNCANADYVVTAKGDAFGISDTGLFPVTTKLVKNRQKTTLLNDAPGFYDFSFWKDTHDDIEYLMAESIFGPQSTISNFTHIRHIYSANKASVVDVSKLLYMLDVPFIRLRQTTVRPFPFKYLTEYLRSQVNQDRKSKLGE